ncbi:MAG: hypothetical protein LBF72_04130 [Holosporales bacterium]|nr:hypothetical protein [Holosporales bacterium]
MSPSQNSDFEGFERGPVFHAGNGLLRGGIGVEYPEFDISGTCLSYAKTKIRRNCTFI